MTTEEIRNVSKIFEAFARAIARKESIKIEYLNKDGEIKDFTFEINSDINQLANLSINICGYIYIESKGELLFYHNVTDIQSITTFRKIELTFSEIEKD